MNYTISKLSDLLGAEIDGIDLNQPLDENTRAAINRALVEHSVLVVRNQAMTPHQLLDASRLFGDRFPQKHQDKLGFHTVEDCPDVHYISNEDVQPNGQPFVPGRGWHIDHSNNREPPKAIMLWALQLPDRGGDTQFVNLSTAYDELPAGTKDRLCGLFAVHSLGNPRMTSNIGHLDRLGRPQVRGAMIHPLVRTHPESGRKGIFINPSRISGIFGMEDREADGLLSQLFDHATQQRYEYRHRWRPGDMVIWDNRCLLHRANGDYDMSQVRKLYRIMLKGDVPV